MKFARRSIFPPATTKIIDWSVRIVRQIDDERLVVGSHAELRTIVHVLLRDGRSPSFRSHFRSKISKAMRRASSISTFCLSAFRLQYSFPRSAFNPACSTKCSSAIGSLSIPRSADVLVSVDAFDSIDRSTFGSRGAELYAQNPNLIKKDENRVRADEEDQEYNRQSTLPSSNEIHVKQTIA